MTHTSGSSLSLSLSHTHTHTHIHIRTHIHIVLSVRLGNADFIFSIVVRFERKILQNRLQMNLKEKLRLVPRSQVADELNSDIVISEFELQSRYCVHYPANTLGKDMNTSIPANNKLNSIFKDGFE